MTLGDCKTLGDLRNAVAALPDETPLAGVATDPYNGEQWPVLGLRVSMEAFVTVSRKGGGEDQLRWVDQEVDKYDEGYKVTGSRFIGLQAQPS